MPVYRVNVSFSVSERLNVLSSDVGYTLKQTLIETCLHLAWRTIKPSAQQPQPDNNFISFCWNTGLWWLIIIMYKNCRRFVYVITYGNALSETCLNYSVNSSDFAFLCPIELCSCFPGMHVFLWKKSLLQYQTSPHECNITLIIKYEWLPSKRF